MLGGHCFPDFIGRGKPDDDSNFEEGAGELKGKLYRSRFIIDQSEAPVVAPSLRKARSYSSHE